MSAKRWKKLLIDWKNPRQLTRLIDKAVWSCLFIAGAYLTGQMFMELVQQYAATATDASVMFNKTMTFPPTALCRVMAIDPREMSKKRTYSDVTSFFNRTDISKEEFLYNLTWPSYILNAATNYLVAIELIVAISYEPNLDEKSIYEPNVSLWDATHEFLLRHNITSIELQYKYGEEVRKIENLTVQFKALRTTDEYIDINPRSSSLEETPLSVWSSDNDGKFKKLSICWQFPFNKYEFHADESNFFRVIVKKSCEQSFFITFERGNSYKYRPEEIIEKSDQVKKKTLFFSYTVNHKSLPIVNGTPQCQTEEPSTRVCISNCRAVEFRKNCSSQMREYDFSTGNGIFSTYSNFVRTFINYTICSQAIDRTQLEETCRKNCLSFCLFSDLTLDKSNQDDVPPLDDPVYHELRFVIGSFVYVEMNERFLYTFADFVAATGGVLGFWLGLDATFFISLLFVPAMWLTEYYLKARNTGQQDQYIGSGNNDNSESRYFTGLVKLLKIDVTGLTHIFLVKKIFEKLFWFIIYLLGSILTIIMCIQFYWTFSATPTSFSITEISDDRMILPSATMCLPLHQVELGIPSYMSGNAAQNAYDALTDTPIFGTIRGDVDLNKILTKIFKYDYQYISSILITKDSLLDINESWPFELMRVARQYLILFGSFAKMDTNRLRSTWKLEHSVQEHYNWEAIDLLATKLDQLSVNYDHLLQKFAAELQRYQIININKHNNINQSTEDYSLQVEKAAFITDKIICYWLPNEAISFSSPEEYTSINLNKTLLPGWKGRSGCSTPNIYIPQKISIRVPGRSTDLTTANLRELLVEVEMSNKLTTALNVVRQFIFQQDGEKCTIATTLDECYAQCRINDIEVQCNCTWLAGGLDEGKRNS